MSLKTERLNSSPYSALSNSEDFCHFSRRKTEFVNLHKSFLGNLIPVFRNVFSVKFLVGFFRHQFKIFKSVVKPVMVFVMNDLIPFKLSPKFFFHNMTVFKNSNPVNSYHFIPSLNPSSFPSCRIFTNIVFRIPFPHASRRAKMTLVSFQKLWGVAYFLATGLARRFRRTIIYSADRFIKTNTGAISVGRIKPLATLSGACLAFKRCLSIKFFSAHEYILKQFAFNVKIPRA